MKTKNSKLFLKYEKKIKSSTLEESDIIGFKSHLNHSRSNSTLAKSEKDILLHQIEKYQPVITSEQTQKGLKWLKNLLNSTKNPFGLDCREIIENFHQFHLMGFIDESTTSQAFTDHRPVYKVISKEGTSFSYYTYPWQTEKLLKII